MRKLKRKWGKTERELSSNIAINPTDNLIEKNAYFNFAPLLLLRKGGGDGVQISAIPWFTESFTER